MLTQYEEKMTKTVENLEGEYATIRAGRANPNILNKIKVEYYGVPTPMQQLANDAIKKKEKAGDISEDELKTNEDKIQKMTDKYVGLIDKAIEKKSTEILTV